MADKADILDDFFNGGQLPTFDDQNVLTTVKVENPIQYSTTLSQLGMMEPINSDYNFVFNLICSFFILLCMIALAYLLVRLKKMRVKLSNFNEYRRNHIYRSLFVENNTDL